jgi:hypothetical protein
VDASTDKNALNWVNFNCRRGGRQLFYGTTPVAMQMAKIRRNQAPANTQNIGPTMCDARLEKWWKGAFWNASESWRKIKRNFMQNLTASTTHQTQTIEAKQVQKISKIWSGRGRLIQSGRNNVTHSRQINSDSRAQRDQAANPKWAT